MNRSESISALAKALVAAQAQMRNPVLDSTNPHFKSSYVSLAGVRDAVVPVLAKHGLAVTQMLSIAERGVICETMLLHESGEWISSTLELPATKFDAQGIGSAATYARRYALMALACVVGDEDDDGNQAVYQGPQTVKQPHKPAKPAVPSVHELMLMLQAATSQQDLIAAWRTVVSHFQTYPNEVANFTAEKDRLKALLQEAA